MKYIVMKQGIGSARHIPLTEDFRGTEYECLHHLGGIGVKRVFDNNVFTAGNTVYSLIKAPPASGSERARFDLYTQYTGGKVIDVKVCSHCKLATVNIFDDPR